MADRARPVTATEVRAVVARGAPRRFTVGDGLHLWVKGPGKAQWVLRYRAPDGKRRDMGLGAFPKVSLSDARAAARAARTGTKDPLAARQAQEREAAEREAAERERQAAGARTFKVVARWRWRRRSGPAGATPSTPTSGSRPWRPTSFR